MEFLKNTSIIRLIRRAGVKSLSKNEMYGDIQIKKNSYNYDTKIITELINRSSFLEVTKQLILNNINLLTI